MNTSNYDVALDWATDLYGSPNFLEFWFPRHHFIEAERGESWMSATRTDKDKRYGMAIGEGAQPNPAWNHFSFSAHADQSLIDSSHFKHDGGWIAYVIRTDLFAHQPSLETLGEEESWDEINSFLETHFPDASVKAGNPEVQTWPVLRGNGSELLAVGALSLWESGALAANSIGVNSTQRGQGIGKRYVEGMIATAHHLGYKTLCLGVYNKNIAGIKLYESVGFTRVDEFFHYTEVDDTEKRRNRPVRD